MSELSSLSRKYLLQVLRNEWNRVQSGEQPNPDVMKIALRIVESVGSGPKKAAEEVSWEEVILESGTWEGSGEGDRPSEVVEGPLVPRRGSRIRKGKRNRRGLHQPWEAPGDILLVSHVFGQRFKHGGDQYVSLELNDILCAVEDYEP
jgi:hypothetical protein